MSEVPFNGLESLRVPPGAGFDPRAPELEEFVSFRLSVLSNLLSRHSDRYWARGEQLSTSERRVLLFVGRFPKRSLRGAAETMQMDKAQLSRTVKALEARGWIRLRSDPNDARIRRLELTAAGRRKYERALPKARIQQADLLDALRTEEIHTLYNLLAKLTDRVCLRVDDRGDAANTRKGGRERP